MGQGTQLIRGCLNQKVRWATGAASPGIWESVWNMHLRVICSKGRGTGASTHQGRRPAREGCGGGVILPHFLLPGTVLTLLPGNVLRRWHPWWGWWLLSVY